MRVLKSARRSDKTPPNSDGPGHFIFFFNFPGMPDPEIPGILDQNVCQTLKHFSDGLQTLGTGHQTVSKRLEDDSDLLRPSPDADRYISQGPLHKSLADDSDFWIPSPDAVSYS